MSVAIVVEVRRTILALLIEVVMALAIEAGMVVVIEAVMEIAGVMAIAAVIVARLEDIKDQTEEAREATVDETIVAGEVMAEISTDDPRKTVAIVAIREGTTAAIETTLDAVARPRETDAALDPVTVGVETIDASARAGDAEGLEEDMEVAEETLEGEVEVDHPQRDQLGPSQCRFKSIATFSRWLPSQIGLCTSTMWHLSPI